ncbi:DNA-binding protein snt1, partial [Coemansia sp. RSA 2610]
MSYNRPHPDPQHTSGAGSRDRDRDRDHYRTPSRSAHGTGEGSVVRDRRRAMSSDRDARNPPPPAGGEARSHSRSRHSRWPYDSRHRGGTVSGAPTEAERSRDWDRGSRRDREHMGLSRHSSSRNIAYNEGMPPPLSSRHTASAFVRSRAQPPLGSSVPPPFGRRATEPGESLEEGELEMEDRAGSSHSRAVGSRTHTMPAQSSMFRGDRRSPMPSMSIQQPPSHYNPPGRNMDRKSSYSSYRSESRHPSRNTTPLSVGQPPKPMEIVRTPSPVSIPARMSLGDSGFSMNRAPRMDSRGLATIGSSISAGNRPMQLHSKPELVGGSRTPSPRSISPEPDVPKQELQSRISDIDREIAECKEKLVQISGSRLLGDSDEPNASTSRSMPQPSKASPRESTGNDRAVPTSPPVKSPTTSTTGVTIRESDDVAVAELSPVKVETKKAITAAVADMAASVVPQASAGGGHDAVEVEIDSVFNSSESESEQLDASRVRKDKDKLQGLVNSIYVENQRKAAEVQARLAKPFLAAFPTLVPGLYPEPTDWPFWKESERSHEQLKPHLISILGREKLKEQGHARRLQEEYSSLYAKWRKRVDKLDRQREAKQRSVSNAAAGSSSGQSAFGTTTHRRRTTGAPSSVTTDEFGFSLGPLFSASVSSAHHTDPSGRLDDSLFTSDAVHSEAELQAIIERLQHDDARNPDLRSQRTAATIPNMVLDPKERERLRFNNNSHRITDPLTFYHARMPEPGTNEYRRVAYGNNADANHYWTQSEVSAFVTAYLTYPKEFGKIAAHIPHKSMNDCVLFYYRNKKQLKLKELEAKSIKRARRSRQAGSSSSGRRRKERARERRERKAREERERMAMEAAAECAPVEHETIDGTATPLDDALTTHARTSAMASEDEGAASATGSLQLSAEATDILERRSRSSALLRSIIAANRQRKREAVMEGASLLGLDDNVAGLDEMPALVSPAAEAASLPADDDDEELEDELESLVSPVASLQSFDTTGKLTSPERRRQRTDELASGSTAPSLPPSVPVSAVSTRTRRETADEGVAGSNAAEDAYENGEERAARRNAASDDNDDEEEGELVEDTHWEPRRRSRQTSELNAYAMGGSIVRTRRTREIEQASGAYQSDSGGSDDEYSVHRNRRGRRRSSLTSAYGEDEEEIVELSGVVADRGSQATSSERSSRPRIVSRRSQSRFGAMLTAVLDPEDNDDAESAAAAAVGGQSNGGDAEGALVMLGQRATSPLSPGMSGAAKSSSGSPPKESALDRYVAEEPGALQRPISSYETLMMCLSATNSLASPISGASYIQQQSPEMALNRSQSTSTVQLRRQLEMQVEEETGTQESVLVGAAVWLREDRRRVLRGFHKLGADFAQVASLMPSKTTAQCRYFYYHYRTPAGLLISEVIGGGAAATAGVPAPAAGVAATKAGDMRQPNVESLVLPPSSRSQSSSAGLALPMGPKPRPASRSVSGRTGSAPLQVPLVRASATAAQGVKRQRTKSPAAASSSDDDDDEMPLAAQLAEELAAQAALERSQPPTPIMLAGGILGMQQAQRRASDIAQVRPEMLNPRATPIASLVLPSKPTAGVTLTSADTPLSAGSLLNAGGPMSSTSSISVVNNASRGTSPHSPVPGAATAKKSGYSSYWSVHERSAFMHYVVRLGQNWQKLAEAIGSKTGTQVRNYFRANREKLGLDAVIVEYERNKAAGTLPPMVPFQPASGGGAAGSSGPGVGAGKDEVGKKERRGRKRKNEAVPKSPKSEVPGDAVPLAQQSVGMPNTAPASITNFPTMGVDGGRAVVYARPPPAPTAKDVSLGRPSSQFNALPAASQALARPPQQQPWVRPPGHHSLPPPYAGQRPTQHQYSLPPVAGMDSAEQQPRIGSVARD